MSLDQRPVDGPTTPAAEGDEEAFVFPVSFAQRRLWLLDRLEPGNTAYNIPSAVRFNRSLELPPLQASVDEIVGRHETLRTNFFEIDGEPRQVIAAKRRIDIEVVDLGHVDPDERDSFLRQRATAEARRPFDLMRDALLRIMLFRVPDHDVVLLTVHHIVADGWSMGVLVRELGDGYAAFAAGRH